MELKFNKNGDAWVAEFEATDKFNLHMEGLLLGSFSILQRTAGGKYTHVRDIPTYPRFDKVFDYDFDALVYPKFIKIVSETEPTYAEVVSDGEITEIKSQTKEVEVTANGTTQVAPDAGYSYLTGVTVKTNVPQSGGSGGGSTWKYFLFPEGFSEEIVGNLTPLFGHIVKYRNKDGKVIAGPALLRYGISSPVELGFGTDCNARMLLKTGETPTMDEYAAMATGGQANNVEEYAKLAGVIKVTKEEFYNLG